MRRLTLILSDLYLPEEADGAVEVAAPLPNLSWLLRFARAAERVDDWRRWLLRQLDLPDLADVAVADIAARAFLDPGRDAATWLATPVRLSARLDHVRLETRGLLRLEADEAAAFCAEFATQFAPHFQLHAAGERNFLPFIPWIARTETVTTFAAHDPMEAVGVNTPDELVKVERYLASVPGIERDPRTSH